MHSWLVQSATWILRGYGILAILHLVLQYWYAGRHQWRLYQEKVRAAKRRGAHRAIPVRHKWTWYVPFLPERSKRRRIKEASAVERSLDSESASPSIAVWVTVYQETPELMRACLQGLAAQDYRGMVKYIVSDDGSYLAQIAKYSALQPNAEQTGPTPSRRKTENYAERRAFFQQKRDELLAVFDEFRSDSRFDFILSQRNEGKREAQQKAWVRSRRKSPPGVYPRVVPYELYGSVDSDTVLDTNALTQLISNFANPDVAAATGYVDVGNAKVNLLTRLIDMRYWSAFYVERAAQSYHMAVMCCSGPLAAYRASVVDQVMGRYVLQRFLGKFCTFGDDRHLTNLVLELGYLVVMDPRAHCLTEVPTTMRQYIKQQTRWNKSFYREMLWTTGAIRSHSWYMTWDLTMQFLLPFLLILALISTVVIAVTGGGWLTLLQYVATIFGVGLVRSLYGVVVRKQISYLLFMLYGPVHIGVLMPVRLRALFELLVLRRTNWGTR